MIRRATRSSAPGFVRAWRIHLTKTKCSLPCSPAARGSTASTPIGSFTAAAGEAFRKAYQAVLLEAPHPWLDAESRERLARMFLIEKAAYEICYEAANRPAWIAFPLRGLTRLIERKTEKMLEPQHA